MLPVAEMLTLLLVIFPRTFKDLMRICMLLIGLRFFCCDNPEVAFNTFMCNFNYLYDKDIPLTGHNHNTKTNHSSNTLWITHSLLKSINKKNILIVNICLIPRFLTKTSTLNINIFLLASCVHPKRFIMLFSLESN